MSLEMNQQTFIKNIMQVKKECFLRKIRSLLANHSIYFSSNNYKFYDLYMYDKLSKHIKDNDLQKSNHFIYFYSFLSAFFVSFEYFSFSEMITKNVAKTFRKT